MIALAGNKCDLEDNRQISREEAEENVREIFESIGHKLPKGAPVEKADAFTIAAPKQEKKKCDC